MRICWGFCGLNLGSVWRRLIGGLSERGGRYGPAGTFGILRLRRAAVRLRPCFAQNDGLDNSEGCGVIHLRTRWSMAQGMDATKIPGRPSHEALEESGAESEEKKIDKSAMESAKRSQNRIHADETSVPGSTEFTK